MKRLVSSLVSASRGSGSRSKPLSLLPRTTARSHTSPPPLPVPSSLCRLTNSINAEWSSIGVTWMKMGRARNEGIHAGLLQQSRQYIVSSRKSSKATSSKGPACHVPYPLRALASTSSSGSSQGAKSEAGRKDIMASEDPFDAPTYNIPEKPVTFTEGASYSIVILAGLGVAAAAAYAVFKELIFEPKEYKIFGKALERVQNDSQVRVRIGSPVTGYGQESMNRAARQRIPNKTWTDEDGIERVEVNFYIRGPRGAGKVYTEMFKDKVDKQWKYTYLIVEIKSPSPVQLMLESYVPA